jgi:hypothetical protein
MVHRFRLLGKTALLLSLSGPLAAQNVVSNSNFTGGLAPWASFVSAAPDPVGSGTGTQDPLVDVNNNPLSGSGKVTIDAAPALTNAASGISQCVNFASVTVSFANYGARFKLPVSGNAADSGANATTEIRFFSNPNCVAADFIPGSGGSQGMDFVAGSLNDTTWYSTGDTNFVPPPSTTAQSALVRAFVRKNGSSDHSYLAFFDDVFLRINDSTPVQLQRFQAE